MAVTAFGIRWRMKFRFTNGDDTIVAFATISKYFLMIDKGDDVVSLRGMTGLTHFTASKVIRYFMR